MTINEGSLSNTLYKERRYQIILGPHISEKASLLGDDENKYVFKVSIDATKKRSKRSGRRVVSG